MNGRTSATRVLNKILSSEWAIRPEWLSQFAGIAERIGPDGAGSITAEGIRVEIRRALTDLNEGGFSSLALEYGEPLGDKTKATVRDGVAIVPVIGPLFHYASPFDDVCGCTSYEQLARDVALVRAAHEVDAVRAVLLEVDSPGGEVGGVAEAADMIAALAEEMPVVGYTADLAASAGYWIISAASHVAAARTSLLGSIGVVATYRRNSDSNTIEIVSSQSPKKRPDVETEEGRAQIQATVDALAEVFLESVAYQRGVDLEVARVQFAEGDVLVGQEAIDAELADEISSFEELLEALASGEQFVPRRGVKTTQNRRN